MAVSDCVSIHSYGGLAVATRLKRKWGLNDFVVCLPDAAKNGIGCLMDAPILSYECGADIGGTWTVRNFVPSVNRPHANSNPNGLIGCKYLHIVQARLAAYISF